MRVAASSLRESLRAVLRGLRTPQFYVALALGLLLWALAYQYKREYSIDIADMAYHPYIINFNDLEHSQTDPGLLFRWSKGAPRIFLPGIGNEPVTLSITTVGARPQLPPPEITLVARGKTFKLQTQPEEHIDTFPLGRGSLLDGDFRLDISVPTFSTATDQRELGVIIRRVSITPADYGPRPVVVPPVGTVGLLLSGVAATYLFALVTTRLRRLALLFVWCNILVTAVLIIIARPELGFLVGQLPSLWAWGLLFAVLGRALMDVLMQPPVGARYIVPSSDKQDVGARYIVPSPGKENAPMRWAGFVAGAGSAAFALAFMIRFGGLTYAQFLTSDLFLHIHNTQSVLRGDWVFSEPVPNGTLVPYPPAHYVLVAALSWLVGNSEGTLGLLLKWTASLLEAAGSLGLAWAGWRLWPGRAGGFAALAYVCSPGVFDLFSAGNYTNLFAQSVLNLTLLGGMVYLGRDVSGRGWGATWLLGVGFALTMLGHYGMMLGTLAILAFFTMWTLAATIQKKRPIQAWWLLGAAGVALVGSFAAYYWHFLEQIWGQWADVLGRMLGEYSPGSRAANRPGFTQSLLKLPGKVVGLIGAGLLVTGASGLALTSRIKPAVRALLVSWLLAVALFALLDQVVGDSVRWYYLGAAPVALLSGRYLGLLAARGAWARLLAGLVVLSMFLYMLTFWVGLIFTRYH